jgi:tetratricopeptide (TPR) repeat protein
VSIKPITTILASLAIAVAGCHARDARQASERQIEICTAGERNGVLDAAADACGAALAIATEKDYPPDEISDLSFRLAKIERQRGQFQAAEVLVRSSLDQEELSGESDDVASRLIELSLCLAGQDRWSEGLTVLERAEPLVRELAGDERRAAANVFRGYGLQLQRTGDTDQGAKYLDLASELQSP